MLIIDYETTCNEQFFNSESNPFACAASNDHFNAKKKQMEIEV